MISFFVCISAVCGAAAVAVKWQDDLLKAYREIQTRRDKKRLVQIIQRFSFSDTFNHAFDTFGAYSNTFFGSSIFSWRAFIRSATISIVLLALLVSISIYFGLRNGSLTRAIVTGPVVHSFMALVVVSVLIDYVSVSATRGLISIAREKSSGFKLFILFADFLLSAIIFFSIFVPVRLAMVGVPESELISWLRQPINFVVTEIKPWVHLTQIKIFLSVVRDVRFSIGPNGVPVPIDPIDTVVSYAYPESAAFFSSMLTSVWLWLYLLAWLATCAATKLDVVKKFAVKHVDVRRAPLAALSFFIRIGILGVAVVLVIFLSIFEFLMKV
ncbi:hypothetical protein [Burkholderia cenocepacia]|uniref:hypothetical protein n=1 Tax=Burkholderia cenocepacia TaxID=95486 RepID=UPI000F57A090|nr:hypothetical protein [Burkholderia cenocepacia]